ncbi:MAG: ATP-binding protein [Verrucomicrobiales bacterium]
MVKIARQTFPKNINDISRIANDLWQVDANVTQLHQALLNLCVNARDAMPRGRNLILRAVNCNVDSSMLVAHPGTSPGPYVKLIVTDTGTGMSPKVLANIFTPFFTTKGPHRGTGLGLSTVLGIVKGHKGFLEIKSDPNKGSEFAVFLPATVTNEAATSKQASCKAP